MGLSPASHVLPPVLKTCISVSSFCVQLQSSVFAVVCCVAGQCLSIAGYCPCDDDTLRHGFTSQECEHYPQIVCLNTINSLYWAHWCCGTPQVGLSGFSLDHIPSIVASFVWLYPSRQMSGIPSQRPQPPPFKHLPVHCSWSWTLYNENSLDS